MGKTSIVRSAGVVSACTLLSRILGFIRDSASAAFFGVSPLWDAFALAFRIPNLFRRLFGEGALTSAFLPAFVERYDGGRPDEARALLGKLATVLAVFLTVVVTGFAAFTLAMPPLFPGDAKVAMEAPLLRIMMPYLGLICLAALLGAALNGTRSWFAPAFAPVLLNVVWIAALWLFPGNVRAVAWAVVLGGALELAVMIPALLSRGMAPRPDFRWNDPALRDVGRTFFPIVLGLAPAQINEMVGSFIAQHAVPGTGAVSSLYYANQLVQLPLGLIGTAVATVVFPLFASPKEDFNAVYCKAVRLVLFLAVPATLGLVVLAEPIVALLFERRAFGPADTARVAGIVVLYAAGLWCYCANQVQVRAFYARKDTRTPVRVSACMVLLNFGLTMALVWTWHERGIAVANSVTGLATFVVLNVRLRKREPGLDLRPVWIGLGRSLVASLLMGAAAYGVYRLLGPGSGATLGPKLVRALVPIAAGIAVYLVLARLFGMDEARLLGRRTHDDRRVPGPDPPDLPRAGPPEGSG
jgi:putative peptidoglycan lipid II flippase